MVSFRLVRNDSHRKSEDLYILYAPTKKSDVALIMDISTFIETCDTSAAGEKMFELMRQLYPICRSITGDGVRETLNTLKRHIPLRVHEVPSGTKVFDWTVPKEWNISDAYVCDSHGRKVVDFKKNNLHVMSYSIPVRKKMSLHELNGHLFTLPEHPEWIPYRTSYYRDDWGFCLSHADFEKLKEDDYEVVIDSSLKEGNLTFGEFVIRGESEDEMLISCHICHPSLCNDNLSGVVLSTILAESLSTISLRRSYRFLFIPGTIGSITWLSLNESGLSRIRHGLVTACLGDPGFFSYKKSRRGNAEIDRVVSSILRQSGREFSVTDFSPFGYDERQYCSPGIDLPVGCLMRSPHGSYPEYHTSADNLDFVRPECLAESLSTCLSIINVLEHNGRYLNLNAKCEPQLGRRGLYGAVGGQKRKKDIEMAMLWVLNLSDGRNDLLTISEKSGLDFSIVHEAADALHRHSLLAPLKHE